MKAWAIFIFGAVIKMKIVFNVFDAFIQGGLTSNMNC